MQTARLLRQFLKKPAELRASAGIDVSGIRTLGIILGPYRNLTTLTAGLLALHPGCQVLNHAGMRIFQWKRLNIFKDPEREKTERFMRYAVHISRGGRRGDYGGSITLSHAFTREPMRGLYASRYGTCTVKDEIRSLVWKESLRITNILRSGKTDLDLVMKEIPRIRFILPVRNPLDTASSNIKTGKTAIFRGLERNAALEGTVTAVLKELRWFMDLSGRWEGRFFHYFQHSWNRGTLNELAAFLELPADERWIQDAISVFRVKGSYTYTRPQLEHYRSEVNRLFENHPDFRERLLQFAEE